MHTTEHHAARRLPGTTRIARVIAGGAAVFAVAIGSAVAAPAASISPICPDPLAETRNFTVVLEDNAILGSTGAGGEIEGSVATGGNIGFGLYNFLDNTDGSALPTIGSPATQLLVGGTVDYSGAQKLDLNAGFGKITDTSGLRVTADGRLVLDDANRYLKSQFGTGQNSVSEYTAAAGTFSEAFPVDYFDRLRSLSSQYSSLVEGDDTAIVSASGTGELRLMLEDGKTNVWNVGAAELATATALSFDGTTPDADTRLVINVLPDGSTGVGGLRLNGDPVADRHFAPWVVWNFQGWQDLRLAGSTEMSGILLAPDAALDYNRTNPFRGQILAESINITGSGEIHHWSYEAGLCSNNEPEATVSPTPEPTHSSQSQQTQAATPAPETTETVPGGGSTTANPTDSPATSTTVTAAPEVPATTTAATVQSDSAGQLAETGFDRAWIVVVAMVLLAGGAAAVAVAPAPRGAGTTRKEARH